MEKRKSLTPLFIRSDRKGKKLKGCEPYVGEELEAEVGIEPTHRAFAEPGLPTWQLRLQND